LHKEYNFKHTCVERKDKLSIPNYRIPSLSKFIPIATAFDYKLPNKIQ
jgi:hypothetical protein